MQTQMPIREIPEMQRALVARKTRLLPTRTFPRLLPLLNLDIQSLKPARTLGWTTRAGLTGWNYDGLGVPLGVGRDVEVGVGVGLGVTLGVGVGRGVGVGVGVGGVGVGVGGVGVTTGVGLTITMGVVVSSPPSFGSFL